MYGYFTSRNGIARAPYIVSALHENVDLDLEDTGLTTQLESGILQSLGTFPPTVRKKEQKIALVSFNLYPRNHCYSEFGFYNSKA